MRMNNQKSAIRLHLLPASAMLLFVFLLALFQTGAGSSLDPRRAFVAAVKRQALYVCGTYPNQYYSTTPCGSSGVGSCANGGTFLGVGCYFDYQCTPYAGGQAASCVGGCCCTANNNNNLNLATLGYCPSGQRSQVTCTTTSGCQTGQTCNNGLCCTTTGQEYNNACGGLGGLSSCQAGSVCGAFLCSTSNYCCECQYGRSAGLCTSVWLPTACARTARAPSAIRATPAPSVVGFSVGPPFYNGGPSAEYASSKLLLLLFLFLVQ